MADMLHDAAVLPVVLDTTGIGVATIHRRLGAVQPLLMRYSVSNGAPDGLQMSSGGASLLGGRPRPCMGGHSAQAVAALWQDEGVHRSAVGAGGQAAGLRMPQPRPVITYKLIGAGVRC